MKVREERVTTCKTYKQCVRERVTEWKQPLFGSTGRSRHKKLICAITFSCGGRGLGTTDSNDKHYQRTQDDYSNTLKKQRGQRELLKRNKHVNNLYIFCVCNCTRDLLYQHHMNAIQAIGVQ